MAIASITPEVKPDPSKPWMSGRDVQYFPDEPTIENYLHLFANLPFATAQALTYGTSTASIATGTANNTALAVTVTADVDSFVKSPATNFGWRISDGGVQATQEQAVFSSSEAAANKPQLVINYEK